MSLQRLKLSEEYRTGDANLITEFYRPCLQKSNKYDRAVGYFRSSVFLIVGPDLLEFAKKGGKVRLICSPSLTEDDVAALSKGYKSKEEYIGKAILHDIEQIIGEKVISKNTEALATLVSLGAIEVKLAFRPKDNGIYHEKIGIFTDEENISVSFKGSVNETWSGWHERGNYEALDVFCDWLGGRDARQVKRNKEYFEKLWSDNIKGLQVVSFPEVAKERLTTVAKGSLDDIDPSCLIDFFEIGEKQGAALSQPIKDNKKLRTPLPHQLKAIEEWIKKGKRGVFEHATGSGKTFTALVAIKSHLESGGVAVVLVPDRLLHEQWEKEIVKEIPDAIILKAGNSNDSWKKKDRLRVFTQPGVEFGNRIVLATMQTARSDTFLSMLHGGQHIMVVADEVHEIGAPQNSKALNIISGPRLGLSATPRRYGDPAGTQKIFDYFGGVIEPPFTLVDAIKSGRLVEYEYHPEAIRLTAEESDAWEKSTREISLEYARSKRDDNSNVIISLRLRNLLIQRSRIAKKASAKVPYALRVVRDNFIEGESWLIYCEDQYQLRDVMKALQDAGYQPNEYHTGMDGNADASLDWFKKFGGIMVAIRCLDQGVDIPKISHAVILASSQNPRQFIQRRGRVLRTSPGKYRATIFDAVVVPLSLENEPGQLSLLKSELQRSIQFSKTAINHSGANKLIAIAIELGVDPDEFGLVDTDGIEDEGELDE